MTATNSTIPIVKKEMDATEEIMDVYNSESSPRNDNDDNGDLFSQVLNYEAPVSGLHATAQYNGNISSTIWQVAGRDRQAYGFMYDDLNRLTEANYYDIVGTANTFSNDNKFQEKLTYDLRGNIETLQRKGLNGGSWTSNGYTAGTYGLIDNMVYNYGTGNRLSQVSDYSLADKGFKYKNTRTTASDADYRYDANGNLIWDRHKNITSIEYNYLNLPLVIRFTHPTVATASGSLEFVYDATGVKLRKIVKNHDGSVRETRDYVNGVEYKDRSLERVAHSEGAVVRNDFGEYQHEYVLRDHLGNTRVTFRDGINKGTYFDWNTWSYQNIDPKYDDGIVTKDDIVQINHYYPFGLNMEGDWNGAPGKNKYQYNGKEWNDDFGLGWYDYGFRMYDPTVSRWWVHDPLTDVHPDLTPYHYATNNPINFMDIMGLDTARGTVAPPGVDILDDGSVHQTLTPVTITPSHPNSSNDNSNSSNSNSSGNNNETNTNGSQNSNSHTFLTGYEHLIGPVMLGLSSPVPKSWLGLVTMKNASSSTSVFSMTMSKVIPPKPEIFGKTYDWRFAKQKYTHTLNGSRRGTREIGRYVGRWGTKIMARAGVVLMVIDIIDTAHTNFKNATPEQQQYGINPWMSAYEAQRLREQDNENLNDKN